jgi:hypothetical protein
MARSGLDAAGVIERLRLPAGLAAWVHGLDHTGTVPELCLPPRHRAPEVLRRLAVGSADAVGILEGWPSDHWPAELLWLLERVVAVVRADMGGTDQLDGGPPLPGERNPAWKHFYVYAYLALLDSVLAYHREHGIPEPISWATFADLGRKLSIDRQAGLGGQSTTLQWLSLHVRGAIYELGRLQFQRGRSRLEGLAGNPLRRDEFALALHIPESGPLTPQRCDESLRMASQFFPRHFPDEPYRIVTCDSWLLDPQLAEYLPPESNIIGFQRRFQLLPDVGEGDESVLHFVFHTVTTPLRELPQRTTLERAVASHLRAGRHWHTRAGWLAL